MDGAGAPWPGDRPPACKQDPLGQTSEGYTRVLTCSPNELPGQSLCTQSSKDPPALNQPHVAQSESFILGVLTALFKEEERSSENSLLHDADHSPNPTDPVHGVQDLSDPCLTLHL